MTYRDELNTKPSSVLYKMLANFMWDGGSLDGVDAELYEMVGDIAWNDESHKDALVDLIERLHDDDLI